MERDNKNDKWLDSVLGEALEKVHSAPDFATWVERNGYSVSMLVSRAGCGKSRLAGSPGLWRRIMEAKRSKLAVAAIILVAAVLGLQFLGGTSAWAQVVLAFNQATNIHVVKTDISVGTNVARQSELWVKNQTVCRVQSENWCVIDDGRSVLTLYKDEKIAHVRNSFTPYWDYTPLILKAFQSNGYKSEMGVRELSGESTAEMDVYEISFRDYWQGKVWVSTSHNLPVKVVGQEMECGTVTRDFEMTFDYEEIPDETFNITIPDGYTELPRVTERQESKGRQEILLGEVVDERGNAVSDARVCASFAHYGRTDSEGKFALVISPTDSSNSLGSMDFPMFVWAFKEDESRRVAWTVVRHPDSGDQQSIALGLVRSSSFRKLTDLSDEESSEDKYPLVESTHQGVELVVADESELSSHIQGSAGEVYEDSGRGPKVRDIVLVMSEAQVLTGRVTNDSGEAISNATVCIEQLGLSLGTNKLTVSDLTDEWKGEAFSVTATDESGYYQLSYLPSSWNEIKVKVKAAGYRSSEQEFANGGGGTTRGCDFKLVEGEDAAESDANGAFFSGIYPRSSRDTEREGEHFSEVSAEGHPVKGGGESISEVVPGALQDDVVLYYSFDADDDPNSVVDISSGGFDGEVHGGVYVTDEVLGGAMKFDGEDDYASVPGVELGSFSFSAWVMPIGMDLNNRRVFLLTDGQKCYALEGNTGGGVTVYVGDGLEINEYGWHFSPGQWVHLAVTYDGKTLSIYINGTLTERGEIEAESVAGTLYIGGTDKHNGDFWKGMIDEVCIFKRSLSETEVEQLYRMTGVKGEVSDG